MFGDLRRVLFCSFAANSQVAATSATFLAKFFQANPHSTGIEQQTKSFIQQESIIQHIAPIPLELNNDQDHKRWSSTKIGTRSRTRVSEWVSLDKRADILLINSIKNSDGACVDLNNV